MSTKKENHAEKKRSTRRKEKVRLLNKPEDVPLKDGMLGTACRRGWGSGIAK